MSSFKMYVEKICNLRFPENQNRYCNKKCKNILKLLSEDLFVSTNYGEYMHVFYE